MKNIPKLWLSIAVISVTAGASLAGTYAQFYFQDINTGGGYYDTDAYLRQNRSGGSTTGGSNNNSTGSTDSGKESSGPTRCSASLVPAGAREVWLEKGAVNVYYYDNGVKGGLAEDVVTRGTSGYIYTKHWKTGEGDYDHIVGKACYTSSVLSLGYFEPAKVEQAKKDYETAKKNEPPADSSSVKISKADKRVYYYTGPKNQEEITNAVGDWNNNKIYAKGTYRIVGEINYPNPDNSDWGFGWIQVDKLTPPADSGPAGASATTATTDTRSVSDGTAFTVPADKTEIYVDAAGKVYNAKTKQEIKEAHYDLAQHKLFYVQNAQVTNSTYGTMKTMTRGYINLDTRGMQPAVAITPPTYKKTEYEQEVKSVFKDVPKGQYFTEPIKKAVERGWIPESGYFRPAENMNRCDFAAIVIKALSIPLADPGEYYTGFPDVPASHTAAPYVYTGVLKGYWKGQQDGSGRFACDQGLNRAEMAIVLVRILDLKEESAGYKPADAAPDWALSAIRKVHRAGFMTGLGDGKKWGAGNRLSRADTITALSRVLGQ